MILVAKRNIIRVFLEISRAMCAYTRRLNVFLVFVWLGDDLNWYHPLNDLLCGDQFLDLEASSGTSLGRSCSLIDILFEKWCALGRGGLTLKEICLSMTGDFHSSLLSKGHMLYEVWLISKKKPFKMYMVVFSPFFYLDTPFWARASISSHLSIFVKFIESWISVFGNSTLCAKN